MPDAGADTVKSKRAPAARRPSCVLTIVATALFGSSCGTLPGEGEEWTALFDGRGLDVWKVTEFGGQGEVFVEDGCLVLGAGEPLTGVTWTGGLPRGNYELHLRGARTQGSDFFCGLTFPVGSEHCTLVLGGWGGVVVGLSNLDDLDAEHNESRRLFDFVRGRFYEILLRVTATHISAWIDGARIVHQDIRGRRLSLRPEVESSRPLGLASFATEASFESIRWRQLDAPRRVRAR